MAGIIYLTGFGRHRDSTQPLKTRQQCGDIALRNQTDYGVELVATVRQQQLWPGQQVETKSVPAQAQRNLCPPAISKFAVDMIATG